MELLVVIALIALIAVVVIITLNPAELLNQSRDAVRLSDMKALNGAITIYASDQRGSPKFSLGSFSVTYISIPDPMATTTAGTDCSGIGGPFMPGGSFHCPASSTYRNVDGTGWIPVNLSAISFGSPIATLPVDPTNTTSSNEYYSYQTDGSTFKLTALPESNTSLARTGLSPNTFFSGSNLLLDGGYWVIIPKNTIFGTNNFYVMKYDAACARITSGIAETSPSTGYNGYSDIQANCIPENGLAPAALPNAIPIVNISQASATAYCANIGAHLITNNEWQTIAWNAESQDQNWSGSLVGSGYVYSGHNDAVPNQASVASANDSESCVGTDGPSSCGGTGTNASQIRTLTLSDSSTIWDMGGNISEWTSDTITGTNEPNAGPEAGFNWIEFPSVTTWGSMTQQAVGPINSTWNSAQGIGQLYSEDANDSTVYGLDRGGHWNNSIYAGVDALAMYGASSYVNTYVGFRCAR